MKKVIFGMLIAAVTAVIAVPLAVAGGGNSDAANACKQGGWQNLVRQDGTGFADQGPCVSYVVNGGVPKAKAAPSTAVSEPTFNYNVNSCSVTVPFTPGIDTVLHGVNGYTETPITHDVTITAGLVGADGTAGQFWVGYKVQPGYVDSNPGAGTSHIDFYNGDLVADCGATGDVTWSLAGTGITGSVVFNANATGGSIEYHNSNGMWLKGVVTDYRQVNANTAVFVGTITDGSSDFIDYTDPDVFYAKVVDGGSNGDQIAVLANQPGFNGVDSINANWDMEVDGHGDVTSGNLVVH